MSDIPDVHAHGGALEAGVKGAKRVIVDGAGHLVHLEQPAAFNALVLDFLRPGDVAARIWRERQADSGGDAARLLTAYDAAAPLGVELKALTEKDGAAVMDLSYASPRGGRVAGYLVLPRGKGPFPGVLFLHPGQGGRSTFLDEAVALAGRGIASLTIDNPEQRAAAGAPARGRGTRTRRAPIGRGWSSTRGADSTCWRRGRRSTAGGWRWSATAWGSRSARRSRRWTRA